MTQQTGTHALRDRLDGDVLFPGDGGYDNARSVWNAMVDHRPQVIVRCANSDDVSAAVRFATENDLEIGIRCGGHSVIGHAVPDDGLMIDLTPMGGVRVDPKTRRAWVQGGAMLGDLDRAAQEHGLATTAGNVSHTGVGGLTLGGGMGWLARQYGLSCDNVVSFEVVTATGDIVRTSASENDDLFWGLRGGGGNFGVVAEFEFQLHPVDGQTLHAILVFDLDNAPAAFRVWRDLTAEAPRQATFTAWVGNSDGRPQAALGFVWVGDVAAGRKLIPEFRALGRAQSEQVDERTYVDLQRMDDTVEEHAFRRYWKGHYLRSLPDDAIDAFLLRGTSDGHGDFLPNASFQAYGGAIGDVAAGDTAFSHRDTLVEFVSASRWDVAAEDETRIGAARKYAATLEPFATGAYVNALTDEGQAGVERAYPAEQLTRLTAVKDAWDPHNVFHLNHNIRPSAQSA